MIIIQSSLNNCVNIVNEGAELFNYFLLHSMNKLNWQTKLSLKTGTDYNQSWIPNYMPQFGEYYLILTLEGCTITAIRSIDMLLKHP